METVQDFDLTLAPSSPGGVTQTVLPGGTATYDLALGPASGPTFPAAISLTVSGLPLGATSTISPQVLAAGSGLTNVTLTVVLAKTTAALRSGERMSIFPSSGGVAGAASSFAFQAGGGLDWNVWKNIGVRVVEADYVRSTLPNSFNNTQHDLRLAAGISFHFKD